MPAPDASSGGPGTSCVRRTPARRASPTRARRPAAGSLPDETTRSFVSPFDIVLERPSGQVDEDLFQARFSRTHLVPVLLLQPVNGVERHETTLLQNGDTIAERRRLGHVMRAEENRRVVPLAQLAHELLHVELGARVEP